MGSRDDRPLRHGPTSSAWRAVSGELDGLAYWEISQAIFGFCRWRVAALVPILGVLRQRGERL